MVDTIETPALDAGYDTDFFLWTQQQAARLREAARARINAPVDWENVAAEIESVGGEIVENYAALRGRPMCIC